MNPFYELLAPPHTGWASLLKGGQGVGIAPLNQARGALPPIAPPICAATYNLD